VTTLLPHIVFMRNVLCFNAFSHFTWFNMGRITKEYNCLIKGLWTEKNGGRTPNKRVFERNKRWSLSRIKRLLKQENPAIADKPARRLKFGSRVSQWRRKWHHSIVAYGFPLPSYRNFVSKTHCFETARHNWSKIAGKTYPTFNWRPLSSKPPQISAWTLSGSEGGPYCLGVAGHKEKF